MNKSELHKQIEDANKSVRRTKKLLPYIYPEYSRMLAAKRELEEAKQRYKEAKEMWDNLGK